MLEDRPPVAPPQPPIGEPGPVLGLDAGQDLLAQVISRIPERLLERRNRLIPIELAAGIVAASHSVAKLSMRFGHQPAHGTGFLINPTTLLTNHHNVVHEQLGDVTDLVAEFDFEAGFVGKPLVRRARLDGIVKEPEDDWATVPLESAVKRPALALGTPFSVGIDDTVAIIQHPGGAQKQFALEPLAIQFVDDARVQYLADTQHGSSGAPVFNVRMHVIALHHAEAEVEVQIDGGTEVQWRNEGIAMQRLMERLQQHHIAFTTNDGGEAVTGSVGDASPDVCFDAYVEGEGFEPTMLPTDVDVVAATSDELALAWLKQWQPGQELRIRFRDGATALHELVEQFAREWLDNANLGFAFGNFPDAEIEVTFLGSGYSSLVGTDAVRRLDRRVASMRLGGFAPETDPTIVRRTVLHEFGHAIGCIHEQASPASKIPWK